MKTQSLASAVKSHSKSTGTLMVMTALNETLFLKIESGVVTAAKIITKHHGILHGYDALIHSRQYCVKAMTMSNSSATVDLLDERDELNGGEEELLFYSGIAYPEAPTTQKPERKMTYRGVSMETKR